MRFLQLLIGTLVLALMAYLAVRLWGQNQTYKAFETPYFIGKTPYIVAPWEQNFMMAKNPELILWADVYRAQDESLLVKPWVDRNKPKKDLEQIATPARPLLKDLLMKFPHTRFVVNCNDNLENIHEQLVKVISEANATERVLLQSDYNTILISAKELSPMMIYGSTIADLTRLKTFDGLGLVSVAPFKGDVYFGPLTYMNRPTIDHDIVMELKRRQKKVFFGPLFTAEEVKQAMDLDADGLFVEDPLKAMF